MRPLPLVPALLAVAVAAPAEDRNPPAWRGRPLTTFQHWSFDQPPPSYPQVSGPDCGPQAPEKSANPYAKKPDDLAFWVRGLAPPRTDWEDVHFGMQGVWRLEPSEWPEGSGYMGWGYLSFTIANADKAAHGKEIRVQVTTRDVMGPPVLDVQESQPPPRYWKRIAMKLQGNPVPLANGATHRTYAGSTSDCPASELVEVYPTWTGPGDDPRGVLYVDQVVVDTICRPAGTKDKKEQ